MLVRPTWCLIAFAALSCSSSPQPGGGPGAQSDGGPGGLCGNGAVDVGEACDGEALGSATCESLGFGAGTLSCRTDCTAVDRSGCGAPQTCGNGALESAETCDGALLGGKTCADLGFGGGVLACAGNCAEFDTSACAPVGCVPACGGVACGNDPVCHQPCPDTCDAMSVCDAPTNSCRRICDLPAITADQTLDLNLLSANISGTVTVDGGTMPTTASRGRLRWTRADTFAYYLTQLPASGPASYSMRLSTGDYLLTADLDPAIGPDTASFGTVSVTSDGVKNLNLDVITVSGAVTVDGAAPATTTASYRGTLSFKNTETSTAATVRLPATGPATYAVALVPGTYEVTVSSDDWAKIPGPTAKLGTFSFSTSSTKNFDILTATVSGTLTVDGAQPPATSGSRGSLRFVNRDTVSVASAALSATGPATYSIRLIRGTYDVVVVTNYSASIPPPDTRVATLTVNQNLTPSFDLKTATVSGVITVNGAQPAATAQTARATLYLRSRGTGKLLTANVAATGPAAFSVKLPQGSYDVTLSTRDSASIPGPDSKLGVLDVTGNTTRNFDVSAVTLNGTVTVNGAQAGSTTQTERGYIYLHRIDTQDDLPVGLGTSGAATFSARVIAGLYEVILESRDATIFPRPNNRLALLNLTANTTRTFDVKAVTVSGVLTVNGAPMPNSSSTNNRGAIRFRNRESGAVSEVLIPDTGPATYSLRIAAGSYDVVTHATDSAMPGPESRVRTGCAAAPSCTGSATDVTGLWQLVGDTGTVTFDLQQNGDTITGSVVDSYGGAGVVQAGKRNGDQVTFVADFGSSTSNVTMTVTGACTARGDFYCEACSPTRFTYVMTRM